MDIPGSFLHGHVYICLGDSLDSQTCYFNGCETDYVQSLHHLL